jgi:hypothetical protein
MIIIKPHQQLPQPGLPAPDSSVSPTACHRRCLVLKIRQQHTATAQVGKGWKKMMEKLDF